MSLGSSEGFIQNQFFFYTQILTVTFTSSCLQAVHLGSVLAPELNVSNEFVGVCKDFLRWNMLG